MVALEQDFHELVAPALPVDLDVARDAVAPAGRFIAVTDEAGRIIAYVPEEMGEAEARAHAALIAAAPRLLDLARAGARDIDEHTHTGYLRTYRGQCRKVLDAVDAHIMIG